MRDLLCGDEPAHGLSRAQRGGRGIRIVRSLKQAADPRCIGGAQETGRLIVDLVAQDRRPRSFLTRGSFHNAIVALAAIGGSTSAVVHLLAIAGRLGIALDLEDFDRIGSTVPLLVNLQPAGRYPMDDFQRAGGLLAVLREVQDLLDPDALTVTGLPLVDYLDSARIWDPDVITPRSAPLIAEAGIAVLRGNLAPGGALIKPAAASPELLVHRGRAVVFDSVEDMHARIDDPALDVDADSVLVLRGCGPRGYPGMPEVANMPLPKKLLELEVPPEELARRTPNAATLAGYARPTRGWERLYVEHVMQAETGADLDFLQGSSGDAVSRESH